MWITGHTPAGAANNSAVGRNLNRKVLCVYVTAGYNVCIFAYGQTGSGKTHTMSGTNTEDMSGRGINYRALDDLFGIRDNRKEASILKCQNVHSVKVSARTTAQIAYGSWLSLSLSSVRSLQSDT